MGSLNPDSLPTVSGQPWGGVTYFCTTRKGGASAGPWATLNLGAHAGDARPAVEENRRRLRAILPAEPVWLQQVHGAEVFDADLAAGRGSGAGAPVADAAVTSRPNRVLAIMTADCLPVVLADMRGRALGAAHAGWRGLAAGVLENTLDALGRRLPGNTAWRAWIGPAIGPSHFEVGADVYDAFVRSDPDAAAFFARKTEARKWLADLPALARHRLRKAGVGAIELSGQCTFGQADMYYSYRRDAETGRMATLAWLAPDGKGGSDLP